MNTNKTEAIIKHKIDLWVGSLNVMILLAIYLRIILRQNEPGEDSVQVLS